MQRYVVILMIISAGLSSAQDKSRGVNAPGSIGKTVETRNNPIEASEIVCTISFDEPSGERTLSEGETGRDQVVSTSKINRPIPKVETTWGCDCRTARLEMTSSCDESHRLRTTTWLY